MWKKVFLIKRKTFDKPFDLLYNNYRVLTNQATRRGTPPRVYCFVWLFWRSCNVYENNFAVKGTLKICQNSVQRRKKKGENADGKNQRKSRKRAGNELV